MFRPSRLIRLLVTLLVIALVIGGAFRMGYGRGVAESPAIAEQLQQWRQAAAAGDGVAPLSAYPMLYGRGGFGPMGHGGFPPFLGLLGLIFFGFLAFSFLRLLFFGPMMMHRNGGPMGYGRGPGCGPGPRGPYSGMTPPWAQQSPAPEPEPSTTEKQ